MHIESQARARLGSGVRGLCPQQLSHRTSVVAAAELADEIDSRQAAAVAGKANALLANYAAVRRIDCQLSPSGDTQTAAKKQNDRSGSRVVNGAGHGNPDVVSRVKPTVVTRQDNTIVCSILNGGNNHVLTERYDHERV